MTNFRRALLGLPLLALVGCGELGETEEPEDTDVQVVSNGLITVKLDWEMPPRTVAPYDRGGALHKAPLPPPYSHVHPSGWKVKLNACATSSTDRSPFVRWDWEITIPNGPSLLTRPGTKDCQLEIEVPKLGYYLVHLTATTANGASLTGIFDILVRDLLVVSIGDSIASGEGNPDQRNISPAQREQWVDRACHRSWWSGPAMAASELERSDKRSSVTFVSVACSGASISGDLIAGPNQVRQVANLVRDPNGEMRPIDALLIQAGANDVEFSSLVRDCAEFPACQGGGTFRRTVELIKGLPGVYRSLKQALDNEALNINKAFITEYPDPTSAGSCGLVFANLGLGVFIGQIDRLEAALAQRGVVYPLRSQVHAAATANGWTLVDGITDAFGPHGYCSKDPWIVNRPQSFRDQRDDRGTIHPNGDGHDHYRKRLLEVALRPVLATTPRRPFVPTPPPPTCGNAVGAPCCRNSCDASLGLRCSGGTLGEGGVCVRSPAPPPG